MNTEVYIYNVVYCSKMCSAKYIPFPPTIDLKLDLN